MVTRPDAPPLSVGGTVRVGSETRTIAAPPIWVDDRWRVLTRGEESLPGVHRSAQRAFEQYVDCDQVTVVGGER